MEKKSLVLAGVFLGVSLGVFILMANFIKSFLKTTNRVILYTFLFLLAFSLTALLGYQGFIDHSMVMVILLQLSFLLWGSIHTAVYPRYFDWAEQNIFLQNLGFTMFVWLISIIPFFLIFNAVNANGYTLLILGTSIFFVIPLFVVRTFDKALELPRAMYKQWFYPVNERADIPDGEFKDPFVISLIMRKKNLSEEETHYRVKAPANLNVGKFFYYFLENNNYKNNGSEIECVDKFGRSFGWMFYHKPKWYLLNSKRYVDPDKTAFENRIRENSVIICERTSEAAGRH